MKILGMLLAIIAAATYSIIRIVKFFNSGYEEIKTIIKNQFKKEDRWYVKMVKRTFKQIKKH